MWLTVQRAPFIHLVIFIHADIHPTPSLLQRRTRKKEEGLKSASGKQATRQETGPSSSSGAGQVS
jgi:hypothetical protein